MSAAAPSPVDLLPALDLKLDLTNTYGALYIGLLISAVLFGITNLQVYLYSQSYKDDHIWNKLAVYWLWLLDAFHLALISHAIYFYLVSNYANPLALTHVVWSFHLQFIIDMVTIVTVQALYAIRLWKLAKIGRFDFKSKIVPSIVTILIIAASGVCMVVSRYIYTVKYFPQMDSIKWANYLALGTTSVVDITIAMSLCITLWKLRTGFERTDSLLRVMMLYILNTGVLTSLCSIVALAVYAAYPHNFVFMAIEFLLTKVYVNSFLAMFNARHRLQAAMDKTMNLSDDAFGDPIILKLS